MQNWLIGLDKPDAVLHSIRAQADSTDKELIVCFDYFDTLVTRCVEPEQTKYLAAELLSRLLQSRFSWETLYHFRRAIEYDLCLANSEKNGEHEFSFEDLGKNLWEKLKHNDVQSIFPTSDHLVRDLLAIEVAVEKAVQRLCSEVFQVLLALQRHNFKLLLISDFYLPEPEFKEMLAWHRLDHLFAKIYISAVQGKSKGSGRIYPMICRELGVEPGQLLMIGDNPHADIQMSRHHGLQAIHLQRPKNSTGNDALKMRGKPMFKKKEDPYQQIVLPAGVCFPEMGFSLWLFTYRLFAELNSSNVRDVFFLSKEGELLKKIFDQYQTALFGNIRIRSHYLLASRKATFVASLRSIGEEDFARLLNHYRDISILEFLQSLNLDKNSVDRLCSKLAADCTERLPEIRNSRTFQDLLEMNEFRDVFEARRREQRIHFVDYLDSFGVDYRHEGLHLVDVGWKGSIQDNIYFILAKKVAVRGYYIGSLNATEKSAGNTKKGLLFDNHPDQSRFFHVYNCNRSLLEMVLGASHGSAGAYGKAEEKDSGSSEENSMGAATAGGCHPCVVTHDIPEEQQLFEEYIKPLQEKILSLNAAMNQAYIIHRTPPADEWFARRHARMVFFPKKEEVEWFESLYHYENFGIFEFTTFDTSHSFSLYERLIHLKNIIRDPAVLESGVWPPIILRRFGVGFWQRVDGLRRYYREFGNRS